MLLLDIALPSPPLIRLSLDLKFCQAKVIVSLHTNQEDLFICLMTLQHHTFNENVSLCIIEEDRLCKILRYNSLLSSPPLMRLGLDLKFCQAKVS
jgi:hypothetical protein